MKGNHLCPICGEGALSSSITMRNVEYKGQAGDVRELSSLCNVCGVEQASPEQLRDNKRAMTAFKKETDGLLTGREVRRIRERLDLTQQQASEIFGGGPVAFAKYEADDVSQSEAMDKLIRLADASIEAFQLLCHGMDKSITASWRNFDVEFKPTVLRSHTDSKAVVVELSPWRNIA